MVTHESFSFSDVLQIIEAAAIIGGGLLILVRMGRMMGAFETIGKQQAFEISEIKNDIKEIRTVVTTVAVQKVEINSIQEQITRLWTIVDEIRHGQGLVRKP